MYNYEYAPHLPMPSRNAYSLSNNACIVNSNVLPAYSSRMKNVLCVRGKNNRVYVLLPIEAHVIGTSAANLQCLLTF